ncbi:ABC transporter ATP-binding/permease protein YojI [Pseudoalteromonas holothuriae]|uniref:ABC transporter ATP-binding/permease protein YojI n=1 Tax=Pseudoalteromonas holothuriae TaxID=2963714 RepID=A0ABN8UJA5_9GAMM|nr:cyclic peptide export ABC transporter [Pseudoalteromonas sp. CIP111951]CAH9055528.1 ABC transporter ATP-binding/permease protein YojI [Pseudoalteromonas sp. CIP111951]
MSSNDLNNKKVSITSLLFSYSPKLLIIAVTIGALSGFFYSLIIPIIVNSIQVKASDEVEVNASYFQSYDFINGNEGWVFFLTVIIILFTKAASVILVNNIAKSATAELKLNIVKRINSMKLDDMEKVGFSRLLNLLTEDVLSVANAAVGIPVIVVSIVTIIGMFSYLFILNSIVFAIVIVSVIFGIILYQTPVRLVRSSYVKSREFSDVIQEGLRGLIFGAFELKLDRNKSKNYIKEEIEIPLLKSTKLEKIADGVLHLSATASDLLSFFIIGFLVFVLPSYIPFPKEESAGIIMALLYIAGPIATILGMFRELEIGNIALKRIHALECFDGELYCNDSQPLPEWNTYNVKGVSYKYSSKEFDNSFSLKPVSLSFSRSQINFIVGGNGSGKSTLSKLISLHYQCNEGEILFDNMIVDESNIALARERISVIYSDYYLFSKLYKKQNLSDIEKVNFYLESLGLSGKTDFVNGYFTTTKLSDGQRRRLALLVALIEDKDIYIFDEWAADQDPEFKKIFYHQILPTMKKDNKLVIVVSHDDRYFKCADRLIFMDGGELVGIESKEKESATMI